MVVPLGSHGRFLVMNYAHATRVLSACYDSYERTSYAGHLYVFVESDCDWHTPSDTSIRVIWTVSLGAFGSNSWSSVDGALTAGLKRDLNVIFDYLLLS